MRALRSLTDLLIPGRCLLCDVLTGTATDLCTPCRAILPWIQRPCRRCALPLPDCPVPICAGCLLDPPPFLRSIAPLTYAPPAAELIRSLKYQGDLVAARVLADLLAERISADSRDWNNRRDRPDLPGLLVPVPLHWRRLIRRGHNQSALIAEVLAHQLGIAVDPHRCRRIRHTAPQTGLRRAARRRNLRGAFTFRGRLDGIRVAVIDDVLTTGATARAVAECLLSAGAEAVELWALARTV